MWLGLVIVMEAEKKDTARREAPVDGLRAAVKAGLPKGARWS